MANINNVIVSFHMQGSCKSIHVNIGPTYGTCEVSFALIPCRLLLFTLLKSVSHPKTADHPCWATLTPTAHTRQPPSYPETVLAGQSVEASIVTHTCLHLTLSLVWSCYSSCAYNTSYRDESHKKLLIGTQCQR